MKALEEKRLRELQEQETSQTSEDATVANIEEVGGDRDWARAVVLTVSG